MVPPLGGRLRSGRPVCDSTRAPPGGVPAGPRPAVWGWLGRHGRRPMLSSGRHGCRRVRAGDREHAGREWKRADPRNSGTTASGGTEGCAAARRAHGRQRCRSGTLPIAGCAASGHGWPVENCAVPGRHRSASSNGAPLPRAWQATQEAFWRRVLTRAAFVESLPLLSPFARSSRAVSFPLGRPRAVLISPLACLVRALISPFTPVQRFTIGTCRGGPMRPACNLLDLRNRGPGCAFYLYACPRWTDVQKPPRRFLVACALYFCTDWRFLAILGVSLRHHSRWAQLVGRRTSSA